MLLAIVASLSLLQADGRDASTFRRRVAEFNLRGAQLERSTQGEAAAAAALAWLRALRGVLQAVPIERVPGAHEAWLKDHERLIVYSEPAGEWLISNDLIDGVHRQYQSSAAADEIAWLAVINGLPGECEGYVPCYFAGLDQLEGEYLRLHPKGRHRAEAIGKITETVQFVVNDLLKRPEANTDFLSIPADCGDLLSSIRPLRTAVVAATREDTAMIALIDRLVAQCPKH